MRGSYSGWQDIFNFGDSPPTIFSCPQILRGLINMLTHVGANRVVSVCANIFAVPKGLLQSPKGPKCWRSHTYHFIEAMPMVPRKISVYERKGEVCPQRSKTKDRRKCPVRDARKVLRFQRLQGHYHDQPFFDPRNRDVFERAALNT